jgi:hypothetical protein
MVAGTVGAGIGFHQADNIGIAAFDEIRYLLKMFTVSFQITVRGQQPVMNASGTACSVSDIIYKYAPFHEFVLILLKCSRHRLKIRFLLKNFVYAISARRGGLNLFPD